MRSLPPQCDTVYRLVSGYKNVLSSIHTVISPPFAMLFRVFSGLYLEGGGGPFRAAFRGGWGGLCFP